MTEQIRPGQPQAESATDEDCLELMEMILGALGRDALGLGSSIAHPKESAEWKGMTVRNHASRWRYHHENAAAAGLSMQLEACVLGPRSAAV